MSNEIKNGTRMYINITNHCNANCPFCCMYSGTNKNTFMSFEAFKQIIDSCKGEFELQLEGGEPLLHRDLFLFIEYAISTRRCMKVIILTNGVVKTAYQRLIDISNWNGIDFELKVSVNRYLYETAENKDTYFDDLNRLIFSTAHLEFFKVKFNVRISDPVADAEMVDTMNVYGLLDHSSVYKLQSYGRLKDDPMYDQPIINQNIQNWFVYSCDGKCFGQDLIARSEYEGGLK